MDLFRGQLDAGQLAAEARAVLDEAVDRYDPTAVIGLFSGGYDSLCAVHVAAGHPRFTSAAHIDTGTGVEETLDYVRATCRAFGWPLKEYRSPITYRSLVLRFGFPGPAGHGVMYTRLKERAVRIMVREHRRPGRGLSRGLVLLVGGMRRAESRRRMGTAEPINPEPSDGRVWCSPLVEWDGFDRSRYFDHHGLPRNPVVERLCKSGECLCGAFAKPGEMEDLERFYPTAAARLHALEAEAMAAGVHCVWGTRPPKELPRSEDGPGLFGLCWSCCAKQEGATE